MTATLDTLAPPRDRFVGRQVTLHHLHTTLDEVLTGRGRIAFVVGEAGTGKSALLRELARQAQARHPELLVAVGVCNAQTGIGDPYLPFREALGLLTGDVDSKLARGEITAENAHRLRAFLRVSGEAVVNLGPDLIDLFVPGAGLALKVGSFLTGKVDWLDQLAHLRESKRSQAAGGELDQARLFEQYTNTLKAMAAHQPILLIIDDLQWADAASISLLFHLARRGRTRPRSAPPAPPGVTRRPDRRPGRRAANLGCRAGRRGPRAADRGRRVGSQPGLPVSRCPLNLPKACPEPKAKALNLREVIPG